MSKTLKMLLVGASLAACGEAPPDARPGLEGAPVAAARGALLGDDLLTEILDRDGTEWESFRNMSGAQIDAAIAQRRAAGYLPVDLEVGAESGADRFAAVWVKNEDGRDWHARHGLSDAEFHSLWQSLRDQGYVLIDQESYEQGGQRYYAGIWIKNLEGGAWGSYRNATSTEHAQLFNSYRDAGYLPIQVEAYPVGGSLRYSAIWLRNSQGLAWVERRDMSAASYASYFQQYKDAYRVLSLKSYRSGSEQLYAAVWVENRNHRAWAAYRDMDDKGFGDRWLELRDLGYRLTDYEVYPYGSGFRHAGVWRQNSERPTWTHRQAVDQIIQAARAASAIPAISVAIAQNGTFLYRRGFGVADPTTDRVAHSDTVYRLASVSKAVTGVLALDLQERGLFPLNQRTSLYVPSLPAFHTHTVAQTLTGRSGICHYGPCPTPVGAYPTALSALQVFQNTPLLFTPGTAFLYSTNAYTATGAAMEAALGSPIDAIFESQLNQRYALGTLRAEDRTVPNQDRAAVVDGTGAVLPADDLSWKIPGGGLESSANDLVRFGNKLLAGSILQAGSRTTLWTPPDGLSTYAYGWWVSTDQCARVVEKDGLQLGADSYLRIYPDQGIVIAVLMNRWGSTAPGIGRSIGTTLLNAICP